MIVGGYLSIYLIINQLAAMVSATTINPAGYRVILPAESFNVYKGILPQFVNLLQEVGGDFVDSVVVASNIAEDKDVENGYKHGV